MFINFLECDYLNLDDYLPHDPQILKDKNNNFKI